MGRTAVLPNDDAVAVAAAVATARPEVDGMALSKRGVIMMVFVWCVDGIYCLINNFWSMENVHPCQPCS